MAQSDAYVGTAGWAIPSQVREVFSGGGSILERYSRQLNAVEINSSFYRDHRPETYAKWAAMVPDDFRFAVKLYRYFTQEMRMKEIGFKLDQTLEGIAQLGKKWRVLLVQLPPSLEFHQSDADRFISAIRKIFWGTLVWEPRHPSWANEKALDLLAAFGASKVRAHPDPCYVKRVRRQKVESTIYYRLHGKPEIYRSRYEPDFIRRLHENIAIERREGKPVWCIFDNTTFGYATENAVDLSLRLGMNRPFRPLLDPLEEAEIDRERGA